MSNPQPLSQINLETKYATRSGLPVTLYTVTAKHGIFTVHGCYQEGNSEYAAMWDANGYFSSSNTESALDLIPVAPPPPLLIAIKRFLKDTSYLKFASNTRAVEMLTTDYIVVRPSVFEQLIYDLDKIHPNWRDL
jgi:hypothetical protein